MLPYNACGWGAWTSCQGLGLGRIWCILLKLPIPPVRVPLKTGEASSARDALSKAVYSKMFDYIVTRVNQALPFSSSKNYIGILDIAGFGR